MTTRSSRRQLLPIVRRGVKTAAAVVMLFVAGCAVQGTQPTPTPWVQVGSAAQPAASGAAPSFIAINPDLIVSVKMSSRAQPAVAGVIPVFVTINNQGIVPAKFNTDLISAVDRSGNPIVSLSSDDAARQAGGADKLAATLSDEGAAGTVSRAFFRPLGVGARADLFAIGSGNDPFPMLPTGVGLVTGLIQGAVVAVSSERRNIYQLETNRLGGVSESA